MSFEFTDRDSPRPAKEAAAAAAVTIPVPQTDQQTNSVEPEPTVQEESEEPEEPEESVPPLRFAASTSLIKEPTTKTAMLSVAGPLACVVSGEVVSPMTGVDSANGYVHLNHGWQG